MKNKMKNYCVVIKAFKYYTNMVYDFSFYVGATTKAAAERTGQCILQAQGLQADDGSLICRDDGWNFLASAKEVVEQPLEEL